MAVDGYHGAHVDAISLDRNDAFEERDYRPRPVGTQ
jgi:hypothetical protein